MFYVLYLLWVVVDSAPTTTATQYSPKSIYVQGVQYDYVAFDVDYSEEVFFIDNWPCPCLSGNETISTWDSAPETGSEVVLPKDTTYKNQITSGVVYKFDLKEADYPNGPPVLRLRVDVSLGEVLTTVGTQQIPTPTTYNWVKHNSNKDTFGICPTAEGYGYGWYYVYVSTNSPLAEYSISWTTFDAPKCDDTPPTPPTLLPPPDAGYVLLENNKPWRGKMNYFESKFFRFYVYEACANFSIGAVQARQQICDIDMYLSFTDQFLTYDNFYSTAQMTGDDAITLLNVCSPTGEVPWPIYMLIYTWRGDAVDVVVTATTDSGFVMRPFTEISPNQYVLQFGAKYASMDCAEETFKCNLGNYPGSTEPYDDYGTCNRFGFLPPFQEANPWSIPLNRIFTFNPFTDIVPWDKIPSASENIPNRLSFYLLRQVTTASSTRIFSEADPSTCAIEFYHRIGYRNGELIPKTVSGFRRKEVACDYEKISAVYQEASDLILKMLELRTFDQLKFQQAKISFLLNQDVVLGCQDKLLELTNEKQLEIAFADQKQCSRNEGSDLFFEDACCNQRLVWSECCEPRSLDYVAVLADGPKQVAIDEQCSISKCASLALENYAKAAVTTHDREIGCNAGWDKAAGNIIEAKEFIFQCATRLFGPFDMLGVPCSSNSDCFYGAKCDLAHEKCAHTVDHLMACFLEAADKDKIIGQSLFNFWNIPEAVTPEKLDRAIRDRFLKPFCTGPGSLDFRAHYDYNLIAATACNDPCTAAGIVVKCLNKDPISCPKDDICSPYDVNWCPRIFYFENHTQFVGCETEMECNWLPRQPGWDSFIWQANCLADRSPICMDCGSKWPCEKLDGFDEKRCNDGLCVSDISISDPAVCTSSTGTCSLTCPSCTRSECEALQGCEGVEGLVQFLISRGVDLTTTNGGCFSPPDIDFRGSIYCYGDQEPDAIWGCLVVGVNDQTTCETDGYTWLRTDIDSPALCESYKGCFNQAMNMYDKKNETECACANQTYGSYFTWTKGVYTQGKIRPLVWGPPQWQSVRKTESSIDLIEFYKQVSDALVENISLEYAKEALCRVSPLLDILTTIACDCSKATGDNNCYASSVDGTVIDAFWACPFVPRTEKNPYSEITVDPKSFPPQSFCQAIRMYLHPYNLYTSTDTEARLSSHVFTEEPPNVYSIMKYANLVIEGQIVTNAIDVMWNNNITIEAPLQLCLPIENEIEQSNLFDTFIIGVLVPKNGSTSVTVKRGSNEPEAYVRDGMVCGYIHEQGTYIGMKVRYADSLYNSLLAQSIVASVLYFALLAGVIYQVISIVLMKPIRRGQKLLFASIAFLFLIIRAVYFIVYPIGPIEEQPVASYFVFEFPTFLFLVMDSTVIYLWTEITETTKKLKSSGEGIDRRVFSAWVAWNTLILSCFIAFIIAYYVSPSGEDQLPCDIYYTAQPSTARLKVSLAYVIFVAALSIIMGFAFILIGLRFLIPIWFHAKQTNTFSKAQRKLIMWTWLVMFTFAICFVVKSVLLLIASTVNTFSVPIIVFALLEQIPTAVLLYYLRPPSLTRSSLTPTSITPKTSRNSSRAKTSTTG